MNIDTDCLWGRKISLGLVLSFSIGTNACAIDCSTADQSAKRPENDIPRSASARVVIGNGSAKLYSAPLEQCLSANGEEDLPSGAKPTAYFELDGFTNILYVSEEGEQYYGWVKTDRLKDLEQGVPDTR